MILYTVKYGIGTVYLSYTWKEAHIYVLLRSIPSSMIDQKGINKKQQQEAKMTKCSLNWNVKAPMQRDN
jgi:hypothetical protein